MPCRERPGRFRPIIAGAAVIVAAATGAAIVWLGRSSRTDRPAASATSADVEWSPPAVKNPGFVGPAACAECHADRVNEFRATRHFRASCLPEGTTMPAGFAAGAGGLTLAERGMRFEMLERDSGYIQTAQRIDHEAAPITTAPIGLVYGSAGAADEVYFTWRENRLWELPVVWLHPSQEWATSPFDPTGRDDFSREATLRCIECHNTWAEHAPGTANQYVRETMILGVTCESCHGAGRDHVAHHRGEPRGAKEPALVRPGALERDRQVDLCAQCHSNAIKHRGPAFSFRPGEPIERAYRTLETRNPEEDHVANQVKYLRESRCFQNSDMSCTTCHDPHRATPPEGVGSAACATCHTAESCRDAEHQPAAVRTQCTSCHMPNRNKIQVNFETAADHYVSPIKRAEHRIAVYPDARDETLWRWHKSHDDAEHHAAAMKLAESLAARYLADATDLRRQLRFLAAIDACRESLRFDVAPATREMLGELIALLRDVDDGFRQGVHEVNERRHPAAIETLKRVLTLKPDMAAAHGRLGTAYAVVGEKPLAKEHLEAVSRYDADDPYGEAMLGWLEFLDGHDAQALAHFQRADEIEPYNARIQYQMALALARRGRHDESLAHLTTMLEITPDDPAGSAARADILLRLGRAAEALPYALRAARLTNRRDPEVLAGLAEIYAALRRPGDARETADLALRIATSLNHPRVARIRERLTRLGNGE